MEQAEHELLRSVGLTVFAPQASGGHLSWPRVRVECDYQGAAKFEDMLDVQVYVEKLGAKSVRYSFQFTRGETKIAAGQVVAVCCHVRHEQPLESVDIPDTIREKLSVYLKANEPDSE